MLVSEWLSSYYDDIHTGLAEECFEELGSHYSQLEWDALYRQKCHSGQEANWLEALDLLSFLMDEETGELSQEVSQAELDATIQEAQAYPGCCGLVYEFVCEFVN